MALFHRNDRPAARESAGRRPITDRRDDQVFREYAPATARPGMSAPTAGRLRLTMAHWIYALLGLTELLLVLRFFFRLFGANSGNGFVNFIYSISSPIVSPFSGIFSQAYPSTANGSVFEPATIIAFVIYGIIGWILARIVTAGIHRHDT